jgi:hypothetical protein
MSDYLIHLQDLGTPGVLYILYSVQCTCTLSSASQSTREYAEYADMLGPLSG